MVTFLYHIRQKYLMFIASILFVVIGVLPVCGTIVAYNTATVYERTHMTDQVVNIAYAITAREHQLVVQGKKTTAEAKKDALSIIATMEYSDGGYVWVNDYNFNMLQHPSPAIHGRKAANVVDADGMKVFREFMVVSKQSGSGHVEYKWNRPHYPLEIKFDKMSSVRRFEPWEWIIGSGVYVDDVRATVLRHTFVYSMVLNGTLILLGVLTYAWGRYVYANTVQEIEQISACRDQCTEWKRCVDL